MASTSPRALNSWTTFTRASSRVSPTNTAPPLSSSGSSHPCLSEIDASGPITLITFRSCLCPISQSFGSCAGVTFRNPVAYRALASLDSGSAITTYSSSTIGITRPITGSSTHSLRSAGARGSAGFTATAVSPRYVSGLVVAMVSHARSSSAISSARG